LAGAAIAGMTAAIEYLLDFDGGHYEYLPSSCDRRSCARRCWPIERTVIGGARAASGAALFVVYTTWAAVFRDPRQPA
jgi:hypothetical protein